MSRRNEKMGVMGLQIRFQDHVNSNGLWKEGDLLLLAYSGGVDSVVLATLLHRMNKSFEILHCNFNLRREESKRDEEFVRALAQSMGIPCHVQSFDTHAAMAEDPDLSAIRSFALSLDVPQTAREERPYDRLREAAVALASQMDGVVTDGEGQVLSEATLDQIGVDLQQLYDALDARELSAGSPQARRLFS